MLIFSLNCFGNEALIIHVSEAVPPIDPGAISFYESGTLYDNHLNSYPISMTSIFRGTGLVEQDIIVYLGGVDFGYRWYYTFTISGYVESAFIYTNEDGSAAINLLISGGLATDDDVNLGVYKSYTLTIRSDERTVTGFSEEAILSLN